MIVVQRLHPLLLLAAATAAGLVPACVNRSSASSDAGQDVQASPSASVAAMPTVSASARPPRPSPPECRAISVVGTSQMIPTMGAIDGGATTPVTESGELPEAMWIDLEPGAKFTAKHPHSTRETTFTGPGRVRSCVMRGEESWLAKGTFESVPSSGERPGGEEWLITPAGTVRYGSAAVEVVASATKTEVKLSAGTAYVWTGEQASAIKPPVVGGDAGLVPDGWIRLDGKHTVTLTAKALPPEESAKAALEQCATQAKSTKELAAAIGRPDAGLAQAAPRHVIARRLARAACDVAALRINLLPYGEARETMLVALKQAEMDWRAIRPRGMRGGRLP